MENLTLLNLAKIAPVINPVNVPSTAGIAARMEARERYEAISAKYKEEDLSCIETVIR